MQHFRPNWQPRFEIGTLILWMLIVVPFAWWVARITLRYTTVRPARMTDGSITLNGVCAAFVIAVEDQRLESRADESSPSPQGSSPRQEPKRVGNKKACPSCGQLLNIYAVKCRHCKAQL
jgi:hypothetical protein